jgi:hypothetical protein
MISGVFGGAEKGGLSRLVVMEDILTKGSKGAL